MKDDITPRNLEAEEAVLGGILIDPNCITDVAIVLKESDFYPFKHKCIYKAMLQLYQDNVPIDVTTLLDRIERNKNLKAVNGAIGVSELINAVPTAVNTVHYANLVKQASQRRALIDVAGDIVKMAYDERRDIPDVLAESENAVFKIRQGQYDERLIGAKQAVSQVADTFQRIERGEIPAAISTGYSDIDLLMTGWRRQELTILAARPGIGKTSLLTALALKSAKAGHGTLLFSAEMSLDMIIRRMIQSAGVENFPGNVKFKVSDWPELFERMAEIENLPLWIDDTPSINVMDIRAKAMRLATQHRIDHIFVDYIQLLKPPERTANRYLDIGDICKMLKQICRELDNHMIAAAQLSRNAEGKKPTLADLKESGAQEEDADNVWLIHRDRECVITPVQKTFESQVIIDKQRNGPTGTVNLAWYPGRVTFVPIIKEEAEYGHYSNGY